MSSSSSSSCAQGVNRRHSKRLRSEPIQIDDNTPTNSSSSSEEEAAVMDHVRRGEEYAPSLWDDEEGEEMDAEGHSLFCRVSSDLLFWMFQMWDPSMRAATVKVCKRWNRIGTAAFDVFKTNKAFLYGVLLDSKHLMRLLEDRRLPSAYLEDPNLLSVMFGRISEHPILASLAKRVIHSGDTWMACYEAAVRATNPSAVQCLLLHPLSEAGARAISHVACVALSKEDATILHAVCNRYANQMLPIYGATAMTTWCCTNAYAVSLSELLRVPAYCTVENLVLVLRYALVNHLEPLAFAVWQKGVLSARRSGWSTLFKACAHNWVRLACLLMQQGMQPDDRGWKVSLGNAATYGHVDMLRLLCSDPRCNPGASHNRAVRHALTHGQMEAAMFLMADSRVDPNDDDADMSHNLLCGILGADAGVSTQAKTDAVRLLLERGADPNCYNHEPLRLALERACFPALDTLVRCARIRFSRGEFYAVLAAVPQTEQYRETRKELMQASRFQSHFL